MSGLIVSNYSGGSEASPPTFFELVAQDRLMPSLKPALKHALTFFAQRNPALEWSVKWCDEIFALLWATLEHHHLQMHDASFAENFYGLKRAHSSKSNGPTTNAQQQQVNAIPKPPPSLRSRPGAQPSSRTAASPLPASILRDRLSLPERLTCLALLVGFPYAKSKLDQYYSDNFSTQARFRQALVAQTSSSPSPSSRANQIPIEKSWKEKLTDILKKAFEKGYPYLNAAIEGSFFMYNLLYLFGYTPYFTPFLHLQRLEIKRLSMQDMVAERKEKEKQNSNDLSWKATILSRTPAVLRPLLRIFFALKSIFGASMAYSRFLLLGSVFFFKFLEWWYSSENRMSPQRVSVPPPPPEAPRIHPNGCGVPENVSLCPLCRKTKVDASVISSSGYTYCYACAHGFVSQHKRDPVTLLPSEVDDVRRLFEDI